ncbi:hypothetical protein [Spirulina major]|uniref:hypothetical protein n=1 Tax=Spirulina major TaxID=270636 RepID=UPI000932F328|nr:hypothetical protein [Spirulina major]
MAYSLLSRFQGGLLGSVIRTIADSSHGDFGRWDRVKQSILLYLIQTPEASLQSDGALVALLPPEISPGMRSPSVAGLAWAMMPLLCRFHGAQAVVPAAISQWVGDEAIALDWLWVWAIAVHQGLQGQWPSRQWQTSLAQDYAILTPLITGMTQGWSRQQLAVHLATSPSLALPMALYCAWSTPEDVSLSLSRAQHHGPLTAALTATLMGLYHGQAIAPHAKEHPLWSIIQQLFAQWAGLDPQGQWHERWEWGAIAPAGCLHNQHRRPFPSDGA